MRNRSNTAPHLFYGLSAIGLLSFSLVTVDALGQVVAKPICNYAIETEYSSTETGSNCSSYTVCVEGYSCVDGDIFESCGTSATDFPRRCENYIGGDWNPTTQQCEGGSLQMPYVYDGVVNGFDNALYCESGGRH